MGHGPSGGRGQFPVEIRTVSTMIDRGLRRLDGMSSRQLLVLGHQTVRGRRDTLPAATDKPPTLPGDPGYMCHQTQMLIGTDFRNRERSRRAKTGRVR